MTELRILKRTTVISGSVFGWNFPDFKESNVLQYKDGEVWKDVPVEEEYISFDKQNGLAN